jgi:hypothetical protein
MTHSVQKVDKKLQRREQDPCDTKQKSSKDEMGIYPFMSTQKNHLTKLWTITLAFLNVGLSNQFIFINNVFNCPMRIMIKIKTLDTII